MKRWVLSAVPLLVLSQLSSAATNAPPTYALGGNPTALVVGDFDGDGRRDLATLNAETDGDGHTVSVLLGKSDGTFEAARQSASAPGPFNGPHLVSLLVGDLNGDGKSDLVATMFYGSSTVLLSNGDGTFGAPQPVDLPRQSPPVPNTYFKYSAYPAFQQPLAIAMGDVNGDGRLDLLVTARVYITGSYCENWMNEWAQECGDWSVEASYFNVLLGNGDGTFGTAIVESPGTYSNLSLGDFNRDGRMDLATNGVRLGNGDGTFQAALVPLESAGIVQDFDGDSKLDMLRFEAYYPNSPLATVYRGVGDGTFQAGASTPAFVGLGGTAVADVNGDGKLDMVTAVFASTVYGGYTEVYDEWGELVGYVGYDPVTTRGAQVLLGYGDGNFGRTVDWDLGTVEAENYFADHVLADFDGDGLPELVVADFNRRLVEVARNPGNWPQPLPTIRIDDVTVTEGASGTTSALFRVHILAPYAEEITVDYVAQVVPHGSGAAGYANEGEDFIGVSGTVRFVPGETSHTVAVPIVGDGLFESAKEIFRVVLAGATPNASIVDGSATGTILDKATGTELRIGDASKAEGRSGQSGLVFSITLSRPSAVPVTVAIRTADGTARIAVKKGPVGDYVAASATVTFAPGVTTQFVTVQVAGDRTKEPDETFFVNLYSAVNAFVADGSGTGTILNDD